MLDNKNRYGVITSYDRSWFLKFESDKADSLLISDPIPHDSADPTLLRCLAYLLHQLDFELDVSQVKRKESDDVCGGGRSQDDEEEDDEDDDRDYRPQKSAREEQSHASVRKSPRKAGEQQGGGGQEKQGGQRPIAVEWHELEFLGILGHGASGDVVLAQRNGDRVALKLIDTSKHSDAFRHELRTYRKLSAVQGEVIPRLLFTTRSPSGQVRGLGLELGQPVALSRRETREKLDKLAQLGFVQTDPNASNFIRIGSRVLIIDLESVWPLVN